MYYIYIQWEKPQVIENDKLCNGLKALSEIQSIYSYIIIDFILRGETHLVHVYFSNLPCGPHLAINMKKQLYLHKMKIISYRIIEQ